VNYTFFTACMQSLSLHARAWLGGLAASLLATVLVVACGGGTVASVGSGGTGSFSVGTVTGFGSVFVNGKRFDDTSASVSDEDGIDRRGKLKLGMVVKVQGSLDAAGNTTASSITFDSELLGPVQPNVDRTSQTFTIIGQKVLVNAATVFDALLPKGFDDIKDNQTLEVHGFLNPATNELQATLIELKSNASSINKYKIGGAVSNLQSGSQIFQIGAETISYAGLNGSDVPQVFANGALIKVWLVPNVPIANAAWTATRVRINKDAAPDQESAEVEGLITTPLTASLQFSVGSVSVDASKASLPDGTAGLVVGARVEVNGSFMGGTLVASEVKLQQSSGKQIDLIGGITRVDSTSKTFVLRGVTVSYAGTVQYDNGKSAADLIVNAQIEVKGDIAPNSSIVNATRIRFRN
jgi:hypothetical protein